MSRVELKPINRRRMRFCVKGTSPLIMHKWSEKALVQMREKGSGRKTKNRENRDPEAEAKAATYTTDAGEVGISGMAFKNAMITAAHKDIGIEKTLVRKALFLVVEDSNRVIPIEASQPVMREDCVRVGAGSADLRYRPEFSEWSFNVELEVDADLLTCEDVLTLVDRAGFGVGIGEWRPEKNGEYGRFEVDRSVPVTFE